MNNTHNEHIAYARLCIQEIEDAYANYGKVSGKVLNIFRIASKQNHIRRTDGIALTIIYEDKLYSPHLIENFEQLLKNAKQNLKMEHYKRGT